MTNETKYTAEENTMKLVNAIIDNLCGRRGFDEAFDVDDDVLDEIKQEMADLLRQQSAQSTERVPHKGFGIACTVAWTELYNAMTLDGMAVGNKCGKATRKWIEGVVANEFAQPTERAPYGYVLVPIEPTLGMIQAGMLWLTNYGGMRKSDKESALYESYKAMLAAAKESTK